MEQESVGKLKAKALEHQKFLKERRRAAGLGLSYPMTRTTKEVNEGATAPGTSIRRATDFLGN
jgi:hypothetical protein